jgi:hypothetical protein
VDEVADAADVENEPLGGPRDGLPAQGGDHAVRLRAPSDGHGRVTAVVKVLAVTLVVCALVAAGCGGSKKKSASPTTSSTSAAGTSTTSSDSATSMNCAQLLALGTKLAQALQTTSGSAETRIENEAKVFQQFADAAPSDVRGDFQTLAAAFTTYIHALEKAGLKPGKVPTQAQIAQIQAAAKAFSTPKLRAAEQHLTAWAQKNCGAAPGTTTG